MTKEELYEEFKNVTHFDDTDLDITVQKITGIEMDGRLIASGFDGILIRLNIRNMPWLTYFHKEDQNDRHTSSDS